MQSSGNPQNHRVTKAAMAKAHTTPTTIPAIAPPLKPDFFSLCWSPDRLDVDVDVDVDVGDDDGTTVAVKSAVAVSVSMETEVRL